MKIEDQTGTCTLAEGDWNSLAYSMYHLSPADSYYRFKYLRNRYSGYNAANTSYDAENFVKMVGYDKDTWTFDHLPDHVIVLEEDRDDEYLKVLRIDIEQQVTAEVEDLMLRYKMKAGKQYVLVSRKWMVNLFCLPYYRVTTPPKDSIVQRKQPKKNIITGILDFLFD